MKKRVGAQPTLSFCLKIRTATINGEWCVPVTNAW